MEKRMAHLWFLDDEGVWSVVPLEGRAVDISVHPPRAMAEDYPEDHLRAAVVCAGSGEARAWVLLAGASGDVRVNGFSAVAGVRVLRDRDEIRADSVHTLFFSTETLAHIEDFLAGERAIFCGRCRQAMQNGELGVRCPRCGIWYHQTDKLPCWTYSPTCAFCPQSTTLDEGYAWTPEV
jgi:hypothetical protein